MHKERSTKIIAPLVLCMVLYVGVYATMRWRKILIRAETNAIEMKVGPLLSSIRPGHDLRSSGVGAFKNMIAGPVATIYTPLRAIEAEYWNTLRKE